MNNLNCLALAHQALGEFVVIFQWIENTYRQMGWFILDPERVSSMLPKKLRRKTNQELIDVVTELFVDLTNRFELPGGVEISKDMLELRNVFHDLRSYRNRLLHSTFIEFKAGGESYGYLRASPERSIDPETGEVLVDQESFSADSIHSRIREFGPHIFSLSVNFSQLRMWYPFENFPPRN